MDPTTKLVLEIFFGTLTLCAIFGVYLYLRKKNPRFPFSVPTKVIPKPPVVEPPVEYDPRKRPPKEHYPPEN